MALTTNCALIAVGSACFAQAPTQTKAAPKFTPAMGEVLKNAQACTQLQNLKGLGKVSVLVEALPLVCAGILTRDDLQTALELRLRSYGIKVEPMFTSTYTPYLYLNVVAVKQQYSYAYSINLSLNEFAMPMRNMSSLVNMRSWESGGIQSMGAALPLDENIKSDSLRHLDKFINDCLAANGR